MWDRRYILESKSKREEMDFCLVAAVGELCTVLYFSGELNMNVSLD